MQLHDNTTTPTTTTISVMSRTSEKKEISLFNLHEGAGQKLEKIHETKNCVHSKFLVLVSLAILL